MTKPHKSQQISTGPRHITIFGLSSRLRTELPARQKGGGATAMGHQGWDDSLRLRGQTHTVAFKTKSAGRVEATDGAYDFGGVEVDVLVFRHGGVEV